jgi:hypothetical protein
MVFWYVRNVVGGYNTPNPSNPLDRPLNQILTTLLAPIDMPPNNDFGTVQGSHDRIFPNGHKDQLSRFNS